MKTYRRVKKTTPGGTKKVIEVKQKPQRPKCGICGKALAGIKAASDAKNRNTAKSAKTVNRAYGGVLCGSCTRDVITKGVRQ